MNLNFILLYLKKKWIIYWNIKKIFCPESGSDKQGMKHNDACCCRNQSQVDVVKYEVYCSCPAIDYWTIITHPEMISPKPQQYANALLSWF